MLPPRPPQQPVALPKSSAISTRADGSTEPFGLPGTLLGILPDPELSDQTIELAPGDAIVLYTDGVTEARAPDVLLEPEDLARLVQRCSHQAASDIARCIEDAVPREAAASPQDDIAILVLRASGERRGATARGGAADRFSAD